MEKQIEEIAKAIYDSKVAIDGSDMAFGLFDEDDHFHRIARFLYKQNVRIIPDGAKVFIPNEERYVLLSKEEYKSLCCSIGVPREEVDRVVDMVEQEARKETAREILADIDNHGVYSKEWTNWLRKQYGVEIEE